MKNSFDREVRLDTIGQIKRYLNDRNNGPGTRRKFTDRQLLAYRCDVTPAHVSRMLNGTRSVTARFMEQARALAEHNIDRENA